MIRPAVLSLSGVFLLFSAAPLLAIGDDDANSGATKPPKCKSGYVYSKKKKRCVRQQSDLLERSDLVDYAWTLTYSGEHLRAIRLFQAAGINSDPRVLNGLGYSHRKLGHLVTGISYYQRALEIDPNYVLARSYLGEGYMLSGRTDLARRELAEIEARCGKQCREYVYLYQAIETGSPNDW